MVDLVLVPRPLRDFYDDFDLDAAEVTAEVAPITVREMQWQAGRARIVRVADAGWDIALPVDDALRATFEAHPWLQPWAVTPALEIVIGSSAFVVHIDGRVVLVDPFLVFDDPAKVSERLDALAAAGASASTVDFVVNSHVDGLGVNFLSDGAPAFPAARYVLPRAELADAPDPWLALAADGRVDLVDDELEVVPGVSVRAAMGHNAGHVATWVDNRAVIVGHLFLHPRQIAVPEDVDEGETQPDLLIASRRELLEECAANDVRLLGHLFPTPGGGIVRRRGEAYELEPDRSELC